jgi:hypothetical protein
MIKISKKELHRLEKEYPGIEEQIRRFEDSVIPACSHCGSNDTADLWRHRAHDQHRCGNNKIQINSQWSGAGQAFLQCMRKVF